MLFDTCTLTAAGLWDPASSKQEFSILAVGVSTTHLCESGSGLAQMVKAKCWAQPENWILKTELWIDLFTHQYLIISMFYFPLQMKASSSVLNS